MGMVCNMSFVRFRFIVLLGLGGLIGGSTEMAFGQDEPEAPVVIDIDDPLPGDEKGNNGRFEIKVAVSDKSSEDCLNVSFILIKFCTKN